MSSSLPNRRSIRLKGYDYRQPGAYFVTVCTHGNDLLLGEVLDGEMSLNGFGLAVQRCWLDIPRHFPSTELDEFVVMPNHLHGVVIITGAGCRGEASAERALPKETRDCADASPLRSRPNGTVAGSLAAIIQSFKSLSSRRVNQLRGNAGATLWQRNYYEHIVRDERSLEAIRQYIWENPPNWGRGFRSAEFW